MAINITDGFNVLKGTPGATFSDSSPIDYRMVVANAGARTSLLYKYDGMKVFQQDNRLTYVWNSNTYTWSLDQTLSATGSLNYLPKVTGTSPTIAYGNSAIYSIGSNVGINTNNPIGQYTYLQIGGTSLVEDPNGFSGQSLPLVFHKGTNAVIGYNYYYTPSPQVFNLNSGSSLISFGGTSGVISFQNRPANSAPGSMVQSIYIHSNAWVGIGSSFQNSLPPTAQLDVIGTVKSNFMLAENSVSGDYFGIAVRNSSNAVVTNKTSVLSFWGRTTTGVDQRVIDIYAQSRGSSVADIGNWTKSSLILSVLRKNIDGSFHNINGISGYIGHQMELKEDGTLYYGPYRNGATLGSDPDGITGTSTLFPSTIPTIHVITGITASSYNNCMVLRSLPIGSDPSWVSAVTRRLGYMMKLSNEGSSNESLKNGGVILESSEGAANFPSLFLVTSDQKRLEIDATQYGGNFIFNKPTSSIFVSSISKIPGKKLIISQNDIIVDIHNNGTSGIGDSGNQTNPWAYPSLSSGQFASTVISNLVNCSSAFAGNVAWMRVGNVVSVSGRVTLTVTSASTETSFRLTLPIKSSFGTDSGGSGPWNSNNWQLNGVAKIRNNDSSSTSYYDGDVASIEAVGTNNFAGSGVGIGYALFRFKPSTTGAKYITYTYQYIIGNWPDM